ncbi:hypothetical protein [Aidingimonas halophila]|uniref:Uncharacterized protein n=1 Tax=Aidingimonas halophila TaxID=574349 RepID=A0A1H3EKM8_9GAMM|nr:hypothetical protein [Aidingimonas halophila]SDX79231.1 hypothetical protein SAMN05443545_107160 [Aidingimonas halophila]
MTVTLIWLLAFAVFLYSCLRSWDGSLGRFFENKLPRQLLSGRDDRWIWSPALAVLGATFIVRPVEMLMTLIVLGLLFLLGKRVICLAMNKVKLH